MNVSLMYPMAAMVLLTFFVLITMFVQRVKAVKTGAVDPRFYKTYQEGQEPREIAQFSRQISNLFETPVLFYVACIAGLVTNIMPTAMLSLGWLYVAFRALHAWVHTGRNSIPTRLKVYFSSLLILFAMWCVLVVGVATQ